LFTISSVAKGTVTGGGGGGGGGGGADPRNAGALTMGRLLEIASRTGGEVSKDFFSFVSDDAAK